MTGSLTYAQQKEYTLSIYCTNISDNTITATEFEIQTLNAFNEVISTFTVSTRDVLFFGQQKECIWSINGSIDIKNTLTTVKRVMFKDGTVCKN